MFWRCEVSEDIQDWIFESLLWAVEHGLFTAQTPLVLADRTFFTAPRGKGPETVQALVKDIQGILGITDAAIAVIPLDTLPAEYRLDYNALGVTAGTWQTDEEQSLIRYDPALLDRPVALISTLVHEVMHQLLHLHVDASEMPGGPAAEELSTDLHCISTGFGLLQLAGSEQMGWQGYLTQPSRAHALALFLHARGLDPAAALAALPPRAARYLKASLRHVARHPGDATDLREALSGRNAAPG